MIIILPILLYLLTGFIIFLIIRRAFKGNSKLQSKLEVWVFGIFGILFLPLLIAYLIFLFDLSVGSHHDVQRGSLLWYAVMENETITDFPQISPIDNPTYTSIGGDAPSIGAAWEIEYQSQASLPILEEKILNYLKSKGFELKVMNESFFHISEFTKNESNRLFMGSNSKGEYLALKIEPLAEGRIEINCAISI